MTNKIFDVLCIFGALMFTIIAGLALLAGRIDVATLAMVFVGLLAIIVTRN